MGIIDKFLECFRGIDFEVTESVRQHKLSIESITVGEREILRMLNDARQNLARVKKLNKKGRVSGDEVLDHEWRVHELEEELEKFRESQNINDIDELDETSL